MCGLSLKQIVILVAGMKSLFFQPDDLFFTGIRVNFLSVHKNTEHKRYHKNMVSILLTVSLTSIGLHSL